MTLSFKKSQLYFCGGEINEPTNTLQYPSLPLEWLFS